MTAQPLSDARVFQYSVALLWLPFGLLLAVLWVGGWFGSAAPVVWLAWVCIGAALWLA